MPLGTTTKISIDISEILTTAKKYDSIEVDRILLGSVDIPNHIKKEVALQVALSKKLKNKIPSWSEYKIYIPNKVNLEQSSSELTALYKSKYIEHNDVLADLTSGLGVDLYFMAKACKQGIYVEKDTTLLESVKYNYHQLDNNTKHFIFINDDISEVIKDIIESYKPTVLYIDPARRIGQAKEKRVITIDECQPNISTLLPYINHIYTENHLPLPRYIIKMSPLLDIKIATKTIKDVNKIEILSCRNEVKEILLFVEPASNKDITIHCTNILSSGNIESIKLSLNNEEQLPNLYSDIKRYIYEPAACLMKSGLYRSIGLYYGIDAISEHAHIYTSDDIKNNFIGRVSQVIEVLPFSKSIIKTLHKQYPKAQIISRDFPIDSTLLQKKLKIKDGDSVRIIGTKNQNQQKILLILQTTSLYK